LYAVNPTTAFAVATTATMFGFSVWIFSALGAVFGVDVLYKLMFYILTYLFSSLKQPTSPKSIYAGSSGDSLVEFFYRLQALRVAQPTTVTKQGQYDT